MHVVFERKVGREEKGEERKTSGEIDRDFMVVIWRMGRKE
jgi:hypothetical protein